MAKELANLDQTIFVLERFGMDNMETNLAGLYKRLRKAKSLRLFQVRARQITHRLQSSSCDINVCYSHWAIICGMLVDCFLRHLDDSDTVAGVLRCMENHFNPNKFFVFTEITFLKMTLPQRVLQERKGAGLRSFCFLSYYLHHANLSRLTFNGERFISLTGLIRPSYALFHTARKMPQSILVLLQYGGRLSDKKRITHRYIPDILLKALHEIIVYGVEHRQWDRNTLTFHVKPSELHPSLRNMCTCFSAILRDTKNPQEVTYLLAGKVVDGFRIPELEILLPFYEQIFPGCRYGTRNPSLLRHMCRYAIRRALYENWELPDGIESLPLPEIIKDYVNLMYD